MRDRVGVALTVLLTATVLAGPTFAQAQGEAPPTFRSGVTRVEVSAVVVDADGRPVRDLREDEVQLFDGGRPQDIRTFTPVRLSAASQNHQNASDARAAAETRAASPSSRIVALLIDDLHIDARHTERARALARQVIEQLDPSDLLFVGLTSDQAQSTGVFTTARRRARDLVDRFSGMRLPSPANVRRDNPDLPFTQAPRMLGTDMGLTADLEQHGTRLAQTYAVVSALGAGLADAPGRRKTLILLTEGPAAPVRDDQGTGPAVAAAMRDALARAAVADMAVYPLSPAGLDTPTDGMVEGFTRAVDSSGRDVAHVDLSNAISDFMAGKTALRDLAALTGGLALTDRNNGTRAIGEVLQDASDHYVLSYEPDRDVGSEFSPIEVRVRRPGVRVRTRRGRAGRPEVGAAAAPRETDQAVGLLRSLGVDNGLPVTLRAYRVSDTEGGARFAIAAEIAGGPLVRAVVDDRLAIEQALVIMDATGRLGAATKRAVDLRLPEDQVEVLQSSALRTVWAVDLPTGFQQVRVATRHPATGLRGMVALDLLVEAASPSDLSTLVAEMDRSLPTAFVDPRLEPLLPRHPEPRGDTTGARAPASPGPWTAALQAYQRRHYASVAGLAGAVDDADLDGEVAREVARWSNDPDKELAARRLRGSAAMALELALVHVQQAEGAKVAQYLRLAAVARDALWRTRTTSRRFPALLDLTRLHVLLLASDFTGVIKAAARVPSEELPPEFIAEWYVARGLAREAQSRQALWDRPTRTQVLALTPTTFDRELWIANERSAAIAEYRRALAALPGHLEAQLRLGRLLFEHGQADESRTHVTAAATRDCSAMLCGLGWLFVGDWHARHGTAADARDAYLQASGVLDIRQSALVALLRLRLLESPAAAAQLVRQFDATSMLGRQQAPDAWSRYLACSPMGLPSVIGALREGASQ
ncbi:VWA domain-containing protein [Luteitalea sp.]